MISVIVPVHNTYKFIEECINSICQQTYENLEIICIDSSTDETTLVLKSMAERDSRIKLIEDPNSSYGHKVNRGICEAQGQYISIVDSDDYLEVEMYQSLLDALEKSDADFVKSDYSSFIVENGENIITEYNAVTSDYEIYGKCIDISQDYSILYKTGISIWTGLYKKEFLLNNRIQLHESEGASFQDAGFSILTHLYGKKIYYIHESYYRYRTDNVASSVKSQKKYRTIADEWAYIEEQVKNRGFNSLEIMKALKIRKLMNYEWNVERLDKQMAIQFIESIREELVTQYLESNIVNRMEEKYKNMFLKIYQDQICSEKELKIINMLKQEKIVLVGSGETWQNIAEYDMINSYFSVQYYYDIDERIAKISDKYVTVHKISHKMYHSDMKYFIATDDLEQNVVDKLIKLGISSKQIYVCPYFYTHKKMNQKERKIDKTEKATVKVSIVVPVYNVENYVEECVCSLMNQTMSEIEIVCVNDGSTDRSLSVLERLQEHDSRIKIITQKNQGLAGARNTGIKNARGSFVLFCDSDDMFKADTVEKLYDLALKNKAEIVNFDAKCVYMREELAKEDNKDSYYQRGFSYGTNSGKDLFTEMMNHNNFCDSACLMLIDREWLQRENLTFYNGILYEDCLFTVQCLMKAKWVYHTNEQFYIYRVREGSIMTSHSGPNNLYGRLINLHYFNKLLCEEELTERQEQALVEFTRIVGYHAQRLAKAMTEREIEELLGKPLTNFMKLQLEYLGVSSYQIRKSIICNDLKKVLDNAKSIEIYGAGIRGRRLLVYLQLNGYSSKISNFVVSTREGQAEQICGIDVKSVEEGWQLDADHLLFIAFTGEEARNIETQYRNRGNNQLILLDGDIYNIVVENIRRNMKI